MNTSKNFTSFTKQVQSGMQEKLGSDYQVYLKKVKKNNGIELTGLIAQKKDSNTSPAIYLNDFYEENMTEEEMNELVNALYETCKGSGMEQPLDLSEFIDFEKAREQVVFKLIHAEQNKELLAEVPHRPFFDLAIVYYYTVKEAPFHGKASILVNNRHVEQWKSTEEALFQAALVNTPALLPWKIENMEHIMTEMMVDGLQKDIAAMRDEEEQEDEFEKEWVRGLIGKIQEKAQAEASRLSMCVLSNQSKLLGAACILYPGVLKECAKILNGNFYVLPSSIHEVILMPESKYEEGVELLDVVTEINKTQVAPDEVLADSVYYYDQEEDKLTLMP